MTTEKKTTDTTEEIEDKKENEPQDPEEKAGHGKKEEHHKKHKKPEKDGAATDGVEAKEESAPTNDQYLRLMAEFQNYKKRVAKEKDDIRSYANEELIVPLLEVLDNFEMALKGEVSPEDEKYAKGMELIYDKLFAALEKAGLSRIEALGEEFDPLLHNAVMTSESDEYESGRICQVLRCGYKLNDKVIRPSMVAVAQ